MARLFIRFAILLLLSVFGVTSTVTAEGTSKGTVSGKIKKVVPSKNRIVLVDRSGKERTIEIDQKTSIRLNERKTKTKKFSLDELFAEKKKREKPYADLLAALGAEQQDATMCYRTDVEIRGLRAGDQVVVDFHQNDDKLVAALISSE